MDRQSILITFVQIVALCCLYTCQGSLTDISEYNRGIFCYSNGYFDAVSVILSSANNQLLGVGVSCSSGYIVVEGSGIEEANKEQFYYFGRKPSLNQSVEYSGDCGAEFAVSGLEFYFRNNTQKENLVTEVELSCTSLENNSQVSKSALVQAQNTNSDAQQTYAEIVCKEGGIFDGLTLQWTPNTRLHSLNKIKCRQIQPRVECNQPGKLADVSCQGVANDCCYKQSNYDDIYECTLAGYKAGLQAWYTETEIDDVNNQTCASTDELTANWILIRFNFGICMNATSSKEAQFSSCNQEHSQWFRFIGPTSFQKLENGKYVGMCLTLASTQAIDQSSLLLPSFELERCSESFTVWKWHNEYGLSVQTTGPVARSALGSADAYVLGFQNGTDIVIMPLEDAVDAVNQQQLDLSRSITAESEEEVRPKQRSSSQDQLLEVAEDGQSTTPSMAIQLPPVRDNGNWSEELPGLISILNQAYSFDSRLASILSDTLHTLKIPSNPLTRYIDISSPEAFFSRPFYCDMPIDAGLNIACDYDGRIIVLQFNSSEFRSNSSSLSSAIFELPRLRNVGMSRLGLVGQLPSVTFGIEEDQRQPVLREILVNDNALRGTVPSDWSEKLGSLILLDLSGNEELELDSSWLGQRAFGIPTQILLDEVQCEAQSDFTCDQFLVERFPCLETQCEAKLDGSGEDNNTGGGGAHIGAIVGSIVAAMAFLIIMLVILFVFVMKRSSSSSSSKQNDHQLGLGIKADLEKGGLGSPYASDQLTPQFKQGDLAHLSIQKSGEPTLLERYLQDEGVVTWNTPPQYEVNWEIDFDRDLKLRATLGVGAMGTVQLAEWTQRTTGDKQLVAVKIFSRYLQPVYKDAVEVLNQKLILREVEILMRVEHPNIVRCLGAILRPPNMGLVLEYMDVGNLDKYLHNICSAHPINNRDKLIIMKQISRALDHLHPSVVHRDLKPQNILINQQGEVKLSDFGLSKIRHLQDAGRASSLQVLGTAPYTAPEVFRSNGQNVNDEKVDIYSLGIIMWEIWTMQRPWEGENMVAISYKVVNKSQRPPMPEDIHPRLRNLIEQCWDDDPLRRPSARDVQRMVEWMIEEELHNTPTYQDLPENKLSCNFDNEDSESNVEVFKVDSTDHINVPADENHENITVQYIYSSGETSEGQFDWRDTLLSLTDEVNDFLGHLPDGDTSRFRLYRIVEIQAQDPQVVEVDLRNISDTLQQHGFFTKNKLYVELLNR